MSHPTDSEVTLVNTGSPAPLGEDIVIVFDRDDTMNTTLRIRGSCLPSYFVDTQDNTTTIYAGNLLLATITRRIFRRDQITFPGLRPINLGSWLKAPLLSTLPFVFRACGRRFEWRKALSGQLVVRCYTASMLMVWPTHLKLHERSHPDDTVAWFSKSRIGHGDHAIHPACLAIKPEMDGVRNMVVLSCLLAEHKLRVIDEIAAERGKTALYSMIF